MRLVASEQGPIRVVLEQALARPGHFPKSFTRMRNQFTLNTHVIPKLSSVCDASKGVEPTNMV